MKQKGLIIIKLKIIKKPVLNITLVMLLIFTIFSSFDYYIKQRFFYYLMATLFIVTIIGCSLILHFNKSTSKKWDNIIVILVIFALSSTPHPIFIIPATFLAYTVIKDFKKFRIFLITFIILGALAGISRNLSTKISFNEDGISFRPPMQICDTSPDGSKTLSRTIQTFRNSKYIIRYYIIQPHGFLEQKSIIVTTGEIDECGFVSNNSVKIAGNLYSIN